MAVFLKSVKDKDTNPIFKPLIDQTESDSDYEVVAMHSHQYIKTRILIAYANNLVVIYNFDKEEIDAVFDVFSSYNNMFKDKPKLSTKRNQSVIKDAKFSIDSYKIMVAVD
jgi:hypothetical protein